MVHFSVYFQEYGNISCYLVCRGVWIYRQELHRECTIGLLRPILGKENGLRISPKPFIINW